MACTGLSLIHLLIGRWKCESLGLRAGQGWRFEGVWTESGSVGWTVYINMCGFSQCGAEMGVGSKWWRPWARLALLSCRVSSSVFPRVQPRLADFIFTKVLLSSINIFYLTACGLGLHILNIYTYRMWTTICTLTLSPANIRGSLNWSLNWSFS